MALVKLSAVYLCLSVFYTGLPRSDSWKSSAFDQTTKSNPMTMLKLYVFELTLHSERKAEIYGPWMTTRNRFSFDSCRAPRTYPVFRYKMNPNKDSWHKLLVILVQRWPSPSIYDFIKCCAIFYLSLLTFSPLPLWYDYSLLSWGFPLLMLGVAAAFKYKERDVKITGAQVIAQIVHDLNADSHCW